MRTVYVAAPYADATFVREHVHDRLRELGFEPTSHWAEEASGPEDLSRFSDEHIRSIWRRNRAAIELSDVFLALPRDGAGGEMFCEFEQARRASMPILNVGRRRILSARCGGVTCVDELDDALLTLVRMRGAR